MERKKASNKRCCHESCRSPSWWRRREKLGGGRSPVSPWGQSAKGLKLEDQKRSDKLIITRRKKRKN